tara:strand:+ start:121 stop:1068 length:948 start_codon:yes stop_codon:yes gene_type:complete
MNRKAIIFGIKSYKLSKKEKIFFKKIEPWGIILFSRNIKDISQLKNLVSEIKIFFNDKNYPILIDQEGGRVSRLNKILDLSFFTQEYFGKLFKKNRRTFLINYKIYIDTVSDILNEVGININTVPVLDVKRKNSNNIIGDRSFSENPLIVKKLGEICVNSFMSNKIATVIKHIPGHGLSKKDSHLHTPIVRAKKKELLSKDFLPFKKQKSLFSMTAHIIYSAFDKNNTATHSRVVIKKIIRNNINYKGIIISDDISMKALKYKIEENAIKAINSGCNLVLHCNANLEEMHKLAKVIPRIDKFTEKKTSQFYKFLM